MSDTNTGAAPSTAAIPTNTPAPEGIEAEAANANDVDAAGALEATPEANEEAAAKPSKKAKEAIKAANKRKFNLKIDGREEELELDLDNEEELIKHLQMSKVGHKRMQEYAELKKGVEELFDTLGADPLKVISDPRLKIPAEVRRKMAEAIINEEIEELSKTPEQKEKERIQKEYESLKKQVEEEKKARAEAEFQRMQEQQAVALDNEISAAIEAGGLPKNARTVRYMAEALMFCLQNNLDLTAKDLVPYVKKQTLGEFKEMVGSLPDEEFEDWVGKDRLTSMRNKRVAKAKPPTDPSLIKPTGAEVKKDPEPVKKQSAREFFKNLGK